MNMVPPQTGSGGSKASASNFLLELDEIGLNLRTASDAFNRALTVRGDDRKLINALIDFKANMLKALTLDQALERKIILRLNDDWENCGEVYRDEG